MNVRCSYMELRMAKMCCLGALVLVLALIPSCLAHRDGAPAESCFDHSVVHVNPQLPPTMKQDCVGQCEYYFTLIDEVDSTDRTSRLGTSVSETFILTCGSVYEFELTPGLNIGFLVQARESRTFDVDSPIRGEWVDVGTIENYRILLCRQSSGSLMSDSTLPNSATQRNIGDQDDFITTFYWRAPATPVDVTFYYTIVAGFSTFYNPLFTPRMSVQCAPPTSATTSSTGTTSTPTDSSSPTPGVTGSTTTTDSTTSTTTTDSAIAETTTASSNGCSVVTGLLFLVGLVCGLAAGFAAGALVVYCYARTHQHPPPLPAPLYEEVVTTGGQQELKLQENTAYGHFK